MSYRVSVPQGCGEFSLPAVAGTCMCREGGREGGGGVWGGGGG